MVVQPCGDPDADALARGVSLARALLALARTRSTGVIHARTEQGLCRIAIVDGVPRAADSRIAESSSLLGDALMRDGALDLAAHARALSSYAQPTGPVGTWLVDVGLSTRPAVALALREQLRDRIVSVLARARIDYRFESCAAEVGVPWIEDPMRSSDLVLSALRARLAAWPGERLRGLVPKGELRLTAIGRQLTLGASMWPEEAVAVSLLRRTSALARIEQATAFAPRALRFTALLALLGSLVQATTAAPRYTLMVRKRAQLSRAEGAFALLELGEGAHAGDARRALRRMARSLHPDALGPDADAGLRRASGEVMSALVDAERRVRLRAR